MVSLQNLPTLQFEFLSKTKTIKVFINFLESRNFLTKEILQDLETFFNWLPHHMEVASVFLTSNHTHFGEGLAEEQLSRLNSEEFSLFLKRVQRVVHTIFYLPQIIIVDIKKGANNVCAELMIGADLRLAHHDVLVKFDHLQQGLTPCSGGIGLLSALVGKSYAKNWVLGGYPVKVDELKESGLIHHIYSDNGNDLLTALLDQIARQAPIQRIQAKRAFLETILKEIEAAATYETSIGAAGLSIEDWREAISAKKEFRSPQFTSPKFLCEKLGRSEYRS